MTVIDFSFLKQYCSVSLEGETDVLFEAPALELTDPQTLRRIMAELEQAYEATSPLLPVSVLGLSLFGLCGAHLYTSACHGPSSLSMDLKHYSLQIALYNKQMPYLALKINRLCWRNASLQEDLSKQLETHIAEPIEMICSMAGVRTSLVYNQYGARMSMLEQAFLQGDFKDSVKQAFINGANQLKGLPGACFKRDANPFVHAPVYIPHPLVDGERMMLRSSCCMYDKRKNGQKCYNCPALTDEARKRIREEMHKSL
ncbi:(2Fe-2S)-binding protein [Bacillus sp. 1P06AnD]|uniref:(2Fe-2S)-binding protein n=1 Tax=Bacillus sp. 1P06AnD TaxID=3132208 RepID=UPI0039A2300A